MQLLQPVRLGSSNPVTSYECPGGVACNVASNMAKLGCQVWLLGSITEGRDGQWISAILEKRGIDCSFIRKVPSDRNDTYSSIQSPEGEMLLSLSEMKLADSISLPCVKEIWNNIPTPSAIFLDTNFPPPVLEWIIRRCASDGIALHLDPVSTVKALKIPQSLQGVHTIHPNLYELESISGRPLPDHTEQEKACRQLLDRGVRQVVLSLGSNGLLAVNQHEQLRLSAEKVEAINVNGAGDALCSGILLGEVSGWDFSKSCKYGIMMARETILSSSSIWPG